MKIKQQVGRCLLAAVLLAAVAGAQAETVIKDQFGLKERVSGLPLNRTSTESGDASWQATPNVLLGGEGDAGYVVTKDNMPYMARVAIPSTAKVITVEAKVRPQPEKNPNWIALGIGNPKLGTPPWGKGVFLMIDTAGNWGVLGNPDPEDFASKSTVGIKRGKSPEYNPDGLNRLKLQYNRAENSVSAWINGNAVLENASLEGKAFPVEPAFAGFSGYGQAAKVKTVSDFTVTYEP